MIAIAATIFAPLLAADIPATNPTTQPDDFLNQLVAWTPADAERAGLDFCSRDGL
jgi:hypothetical protein